MQCELTYQQDLTAYIFDRQVHHTLFIVENAQVGDLGTQPFNIFSGIGIFNAQQDH
jgi:hypothetical protein